MSTHDYLVGLALVASAGSFALHYSGARWRDAMMNGLSRQSKEITRLSKHVTDVNMLLIAMTERLGPASQGSAATANLTDEPNQGG